MSRDILAAIRRNVDSVVTPALGQPLLINIFDLRKQQDVVLISWPPVIHYLFGACVVRRRVPASDVYIAVVALGGLPRWSFISLCGLRFGLTLRVAVGFGCW